MADDNVRGAHFCGKNTGTMGVCLLGNFVFVTPQQAALDKLDELLLWKLHKESLIPIDSARHTLPGGNYLPTIAGHMDGCATECPGALLYAEIPGLRIRLDSAIIDCPAITGLPLEVLPENTINISPNPFKNELLVQTDKAGRFKLYDLFGNLKACGKTEPGDNILTFEGELLSGFYILEIEVKSSRQKFKILYQD